MSASLISIAVTCIFRRISEGTMDLMNFETQRFGLGGRKVNGLGRRFASDLTR